MAEKNQEFSARLKGLLKNHGITQKALAEELGVRTATINNYCKGGRVPEWNILVEIARLLNVSCDWLLTGQGPTGSAPKVFGLSAVNKEERRLLEDALQVLKAEGRAEEFGKMLKQAIEACKVGMEALGRKKG
ncbi:MAG: helix-turn-helix domain-containing protein [Desulfarculaceae bacterium]|nr:helix-turn-helix domain-containing protein [Desulfarculaceae bacterium]